MGRKIILTEEQEKIVKDSYLSGMSCNQILKNTGFGRDAIKRCLVDAGIYNPDKTRYRKYSDEDLDIDSREWLEDALEDYEGTLIFVSHDRYFVNKFATRIWELENGHIRNFPCGYEKYRSIKEKEAIAAPAPEKPKKERKEKPKTSGSKMLEKQIRALEREIEKQEQHSAELDRQIEAASSDYQELARLMAEKQSCDDALTGLMDEWERLSSDLEGAT